MSHKRKDSCCWEMLKQSGPTQKTVSWCTGGFSISARGLDLRWETLAARGRILRSWLLSSTNILCVYAQMQHKLSMTIYKGRGALLSRFLEAKEGMFVSMSGALARIHCSLSQATVPQMSLVGLIHPLPFVEGQTPDPGSYGVCRQALPSSKSESTRSAHKPQTLEECLLV